jgi:hypothetical protein
MNVLYFAGIWSALGPVTVLVFCLLRSQIEMHRTRYTPSSFSPVTTAWLVFRLRRVENGVYMWNVVSNLMGKKVVADNLLQQVVVLLGLMCGAYQHPPYNDIEL